MFQLRSITPSVDFSVQGALQDMATYVAQLEARVGAIPIQPPPLTLDQIRRALGSTGATPLNIFQLLGQSSTGVFQSGTHLQRVAINAASLPSGSGFWETDRLALYLTIASRWVFLLDQPFDVTLSPNTKPTDLTTLDEGFTIASTDFDRIYRWTGAAWADAPGQPQRGAVLYFPSAYAPTTGWQLCDGTAAVPISTATGTTTTITVPDLTTDTRFIRSVAGATGGVGGNAEAHIHAVTGFDTNDDTGAGTVVQAGVGTTVAAHPHVHPLDVLTTAPTVPDDALPPYLELRPYVRL